MVSGLQHVLLPYLHRSLHCCSSLPPSTYVAEETVVTQATITTNVPWLAASSQPARSSLIWHLLLFSQPIWDCLLHCVQGMCAAFYQRLARCPIQFFEYGIFFASLQSTIVVSAFPYQPQGATLSPFNTHKHLDNNGERYALSVVFSNNMHLMHLKLLEVHMVCKKWITVQFVYIHNYFYLGFMFYFIEMHN